MERDSRHHASRVVLNRLAIDGTIIVAVMPGVKRLAGYPDPVKQPLSHATPARYAPRKNETITIQCPARKPMPPTGRGSSAESGGCYAIEMKSHPIPLVTN